MAKLGLFLSEILLQSKQRRAFLEWFLVLSLLFVADFVLSLYILRVIQMLNFVVLLLFLHFCYFVWLSAVLSLDATKMKSHLERGEYDEKAFQVFLSRLIPIFFMLSPGVAGMGMGFLMVFVLARPIGIVMTRRARIDWRRIYEVLRLEQERL